MISGKSFYLHKRLSVRPGVRIDTSEFNVDFRGEGVTLRWISIRPVGVEKKNTVLPGKF